MLRGDREPLVFYQLSLFFCHLNPHPAFLSNRETPTFCSIDISKSSRSCHIQIKSQDRGKEVRAKANQRKSMKGKMLVNPGICYLSSHLIS